jgi:hypothetical protein
MHSDRCPRDAINDYMPSFCNRVAPLAASRRGNANSRVFDDQRERVLYALADKLRSAWIFACDVSKRFNVRLQRPRRPLKLPGGACGHGHRQSLHALDVALRHSLHTRFASHLVLR